MPLNKEGKPPQEVQCVEEVKVVKGTASIQTFTGRRKELREGEKVCITPTGELTTLQRRYSCQLLRGEA